MAVAVSKSIPIADLNPDIPAASSVIHGIVTLVWPYSSVNHTYSFLLVEPDFRLRRTRGQVRISLRGSCARRVTRAGLVSGDEIYLALDGAQWERDGTAASTPGRGIEWQLLYTDHIRLERVIENGDNQAIDTGRMSASPKIQASIRPTVISRPVATLHTPKAVLASNGSFNAWSSPIFIKEKRLPDIFPSKDEESVSEVEEEWLSAPPAKKLKFGRKSDQWHFVERSPSPGSGTEPARESGTNDDLQITARDPSISSQLVSTVPVNSSGEDTSIYGTTKDYDADAPDKSSSEILVTDEEAKEPPSGNEHSLQSVYNEPSSGEQLAEINQESISADSPSLLSGIQEKASPKLQSPVQSTTLMQTLDPTSELQVASTGPDAVSNDSMLERTSFTSDHEDAAAEIASILDQNEPNSQSQLLSLPRNSFVNNDIYPSSQTTLSQSPKPQLEINIQGSTPLVQPISLDTGPLTPRLLPLLSPGLDLVSPLEQRHAPQSGSYFVRNLQTGSELSSLSQELETGHHLAQSSQELGSDTAEIHSQQDIQVDQRIPPNPTEAGETFFNHLLSRYDQASDANLEPVSDQPMSSSPAPINLIEEDLIEAVDGQIHSINSIAFHQSIATSLAETDVSLQQGDLEIIPVQVVDEETTDLLEEGNPSIESDEIQSIVEEQEVEEMQDEEEEDDINEDDLETQEPEDDSDDEVSVSGKWRDLTYKPSQNISETMERTESSPISTQEARMVQHDQGSAAPSSFIETLDGALDVNTSTEKDRAIQDTYYAGDLRNGKSSSPMAVGANEIEVVDLLDSDSSSSTPEPSENQLSPKGIDEQQEVVMEATEEESETLVADLTAPEESEAISLPPGEMAESSQESGAVLKQSSMNDENPAETQQQEFYTAPVEFEEIAEEDLTQIADDHEDGRETQVTAHSDVGEIIEADTQEQTNSATKSDLPPPKQRPSRSSRRITRSQSQQTADMVDSENEKIDEHLEPIPETKSVLPESADSAPQGIRTAHDYYSPLATLNQYQNSTTSLLAVVVASSKPIRSSLGPRDFNQTIYLAAPNSQPNNDFTIAQIFRPYSAALPHPVSSGSIILLKNFKVQPYKRKMSLLSTSTSAWAVFDQKSATNQSEMQVSITGPPLDFGGAERGIAWGLGKWWSSLDTDSQAKITSAATTAKNRVEADLEKKAVTARKAREAKTSSQLQIQTTPRRQTRSSQSQQNLPSSIPNTPSTLQETPSSTKGRKRGNQCTDQSPTPTPTKQRHNLRSSPQSTSQDPTHELRSGLVYSDIEDDPPLDIAGSQAADISGSQADMVDNASSGATGATRRSQRRKGAAAEGSGNVPPAKKVVWHELRDGAVYKD